MDANIFSEIASGLGMAGGLWALVRWSQERKNGNGHSTNGGSPVEPASREMIIHALNAHADRQNAQAAAAEATAKAFSAAVKQLTESVERQRDPQPMPAWAKDLEARAAKIEEKPAWVNEVVTSMAHVTDSLEALIQMGPPPPPDLGPLAEPLENLPGELEKKFDRLARQIGIMLRAPQATIPEEQNLGPATRADNPINLEIFNTLALTENTIYELVPPEADIYNISVMNVGPGNLYMSAHDTPAINDPHSTTLPPGTGDNNIHTPGRVFALTNAGGAIVSVRLNYGVR